MKNLIVFAIVLVGVVLVGSFVFRGFHWPFGGGGGPGGSGGKGSAEVSRVDEPPPPPKPGPLEITIDDRKYLVKGVEVESVDELVGMAIAVPKDVPPPRVRILLRQNSHYVTEHKLTDALRAANVDFPPPIEE